MRSEEIIKVVIERIKTELTKSKDVVEAELMPEQAERVARQKKQSKQFPAIWKVRDGPWNIFQTIIDELDPPAETGRLQTDPCAALNGIIYQMRNGWLRVKQTLAPNPAARWPKFLTPPAPLLRRRFTQPPQPA